jgi:hypothetical protein
MVVFIVADDKLNTHKISVTAASTFISEVLAVLLVSLNF